MAIFSEVSENKFVRERHPLSKEIILPRCMQRRHGLAMRKLSVRLSIKRVNCDKTEERSVQIFIVYERTFSLVFWEEWLVDATPSTWNFGSTAPRWSEIADFQPIFASSASAVTPSEKSSIITNRKSATRFLMSPIWWSLSPPGGLINAKRPISVQNRTSLEESRQSFFVWKLSAAKL